MEKGFAVRNHGYIVAFIMGTTVLSACGGGGTAITRSGNTGTDQVLAKTAGNAAQAMTDGTTLRASERASSGITLNYDNNTAAHATDSTARVSRNASGAVTLEVAGQTIDFAPGDLSADGYGYDKGNASIWAWSGNSMAEQLDPANGRNSMVFDYYTDTGPGSGQIGFIVVGTETDSNDLRALPTATYDGHARVRVAPTTDFVEYNDSVSEARGDMRLGANFGAGTVSGSITNMEGRLPRNQDPTRTWTPFAGQLTLNETGISGNGFTGAVTADSGFTSEIGTVAAGSSYSGTFFGPEANEVAGGLSLTGTSADGGVPYLGWGFIQGGKN